MSEAKIGVYYWVNEKLIPFTFPLSEGRPFRYPRLKSEVLHYAFREDEHALGKRPEILKGAMRYYDIIIDGKTYATCEEAQRYIETRFQ